MSISELHDLIYLIVSDAPLYSLIILSPNSMNLLVKVSTSELLNPQIIKEI